MRNSLILKFYVHSYNNISTIRINNKRKFLVMWGLSVMETKGRTKQKKLGNGGGGGRKEF